MNVQVPARSLHLMTGVVLGILLIACTGHADELPPIRLHPDGDRFVVTETGKPFRIWGVNYDHDTEGEHGRLLEDYWVDDWATVEEDFKEIKALGANVVRVHLQFGKFMRSSTAANPESLERLVQLVKLTDATGLYLNLTGLGCYHKQDVPEWYDALSEQDRWNAQAVFWKAIARTCRGRAAVFCYDLMNEPVVGGNTEEGWLVGEPLGGKFFVQRLTLDPGDRDSKEIAEAWVKQMTTAIRSEDPDTLITVGVIPWATVWPNAKPLFYSPEVAQHLDFVSVHFYPKAGEFEKALDALKVYDIGKPLVIEEMFPLNCSLEEMDEFIRASSAIVEGWFSFYWGRTRAEYEAKRTENIVNAIMADWLKYFGRGAPME
jgi:hypothetical protein